MEKLLGEAWALATHLVTVGEPLLEMPVTIGIANFRNLVAMIDQCPLAQNLLDLWQDGDTECWEKPVFHLLRITVQAGKKWM